MIDDRRFNSGNWQVIALDSGLLLGEWCVLPDQADSFQRCRLEDMQFGLLESLVRFHRNGDLLAISHSTFYGRLNCVHRKRKHAIPG